MAKTIKTKLSEMISEHEHLLNVLTKPTRSRLESEAKKQGKELKEYLKLSKK